MKRLVLGVATLCLVFSLSGCNGGESKEDYLGKWKADNGKATLTLMKDNVCKVYIEKTGSTSCSWNYEEKVVTMAGKYQFALKLKQGKLFLDSVDGREKMTFNKVK